MSGPVTLRACSAHVNAMFMPVGDLAGWAAEISARCRHFGAAAILRADSGDPDEVDDLVVVGWLGAGCCSAHQPKPAQDGWACDCCGRHVDVDELVVVPIGEMRTCADEAGSAGWWVPVEVEVERSAESEVWERSRHRQLQRQAPDRTAA